MKIAPRHLKPKTRQWMNRVLKEYVLEEHHKKLLLLAAESWDLLLDAGEILRKDGLVYYNGKGEPRPHPCIKVINDNKIIFTRLLRELCLDINEPVEPRPPTFY